MVFTLMSSFLQDENGNKMINEYVREYKIGSGSYGKVVSLVFEKLCLLYSHWIHCPKSVPFYKLQALYRGCSDGKHYAIKVWILFGVSMQTIL